MTELHQSAACRPHVAAGTDWQEPTREPGLRAVPADWTRRGAVGIGG